jgi:hypothetical protein
MRIRTGLVLGLLLALGVAGCGGTGGTDGVATAGSPGSKATSSAGPDGLSDQERALKMSQCMRENGGPNFPDPKFNDGGGVGINVPDGSDPQKVDAAMQTCKQYLPNGGEPEKLDPQRLEQLRKLAQCLRDNGIKNFPDPTDQGIQGDSSDPDQNPENPKFQAAQKACDKYAPAAPGDAPGNNSGSGT